MKKIKRNIKTEQAGDILRDIDEAKEQIAKRPLDPYLHFELGILKFDQGEYQDACDAFRRALEIEPYFRDAAWELGSACSRLGRVQETIDAYHRALDIDPCCVEALFGLGNAYRRMGNYAEAIEYYEDFLFLNPILDRSDPRTDEAHVQSVVSHVHYNLGIAWLLVDNPENAKKSFEAVQSLNPHGQIEKLADHFLQLLSDPNYRVGSNQWNIIEIPSEEL